MHTTISAVCTRQSVGLTKVFCQNTTYLHTSHCRLRDQVPLLTRSEVHNKQTDKQQTNKQTNKYNHTKQNFDLSKAFDTHPHSGHMRHPQGNLIAESHGKILR